MADPDTTIRRCDRCGLDRPIDRFYKRSDREGYRTPCKDCQAQSRALSAEKHKQRAAEWRAANPGRNAEICRRWRSENIEYARFRERECWLRDRDKRRAQKRIYYARNKSKILAGARAYFEANKLKLKSYLSQYWRDNPDKAAEYRNRRRALKREAGGNHTAADIRELYELQRGKCACCGKKLGRKYHVDHVVPLKRGGDNGKLNLQLLCPTCNCRKRAKDPIEFMQEQGFLL